MNVLGLIPIKASPAETAGLFSGGTGEKGDFMAIMKSLGATGGSNRETSRGLSYGAQLMAQIQSILAQFVLPPGVEKALMQFAQTQVADASTGSQAGPAGAGGIAIGAQNATNPSLWLENLIQDLIQEGKAATQGQAATPQRETLPAHLGLKTAPAASETAASTTPSQQPDPHAPDIQATLPTPAAPDTRETLPAHIMLETIQAASETAASETPSQQPNPHAPDIQTTRLGLETAQANSAPGQEGGVTVETQATHPGNAMERLGLPLREIQASTGNESSAARDTATTDASKLQRAISAPLQSAAPQTASPPVKPAALASTIAQYVEQLQSARGAGTHGVKGGSMEIHLDPPSLGKLTVQVTLDGSNMKINMTTATPDAKALLQQHAAALKTQLGAHGLSIQEFNISLGQQWNSQGSRHPAFAGFTAGEKRMENVGDPQAVHHFVTHDSATVNYFA